MEAKLYNMKGEDVGKVELPVEIFGVQINSNIIQRAILAQDANARVAIAHTKGRGDVRGGGKKPWKQKGTGRARHASIRSPIWRGGGVAFGPKSERNFSKGINRKEKMSALFMTLSSKIKDNEYIVLDKWSMEVPKTKEAQSTISILSKNLEGYNAKKKGSSSILLLVPKKDRISEKSFSNLQNAHVLSADSINVKDILSHKYLFITKDAISRVSEVYKIKK